MSVQLNEIWTTIAPRIGTIPTFLVGWVGGGLLLSRDCTIRMDGIFFSTKDDDQVFELMRQSYSDREKQLLEKSEKNLEIFRSGKFSFQFYFCLLELFLIFTFSL
jgi:hypothetical protein